MSKRFHEMLVEALPRLRAYAIMLTRDRSVADDLLQETVLRALGAEYQFAPGSNFNAWMYRILRNQYVSSLRRGRRMSLTLDDLPESMLCRPAGQDDQVLVSEISKALDKLQKGQRDALILVCASGLSYEETAKVLGCSIGTVKSRVWRARCQMAKFIMGSEKEVAVLPQADLPADEGYPVAIPA